MVGFFSFLSLLVCWGLLSSNCSKLCAFRCVPSLSGCMHWPYPPCWSTWSVGICLQSWSSSLSIPEGCSDSSASAWWENEKTTLIPLETELPCFNSITLRGNWFPFLKMSSLLLEEGMRFPFIRAVEINRKMLPSSCGAFNRIRRQCPSAVPYPNKMFGEPC